LQFGAEYQLTVLNTSLYEISASGIFGALYHSFFQQFKPTGSFPYIGFSTQRFDDYGRLIYTDSNFGIFAFPFMLGPLSNFITSKGQYDYNNLTIFNCYSIIAFFGWIFFLFLFLTAFSLSRYFRNKR
jgi:hypothetical protein